MRRVVASLSFALLFACSEEDRPDAGQPDASTEADASAQNDANAYPDATAQNDAEPADLGIDAGTEEDAGVTGPTFSGDIFPMFEEIGCNRVACHGSLRSQGGIVVYLPDALTAYTDIFERASIREPNLIVRPGDPEASVLYTHGRDANIPAGDLTQEGLELISEWIESGAPYGAAVEVFVPPEPATCTLADHPGTPPLPTACLPRCTTQTWDGIIDCRTAPDVAACQQTVLAADTSTTVQLDYGEELGTLPLDCSTCLDFQTETCFVEHCLETYLAALRCQALDNRPNACNAEIDAVRTCAGGSGAFRTCQSNRDFDCVAQ
jgi:hypothetical protein